MRFVIIASAAAVAAICLGGAAVAAPEAAIDTIGRICKSEDILMHAKSVKITPDYRQVICPCIAAKIKANAKPQEVQALAEALKLPLDKRRTAMMNGKNRTLSMGSRAFLEAQMICGREHPLKKR
jgi:hypothetical protein